MSEAILRVANLSKRYGEYLAVDRVSFDIKGGEILGLLGPNGAGKSTTIQMLLGLTEPDGGEISYFGQNFFTHRASCLARINYASAYNELQGKLSVQQNLQIYAGLYQVKNAKERIAELLRLLEVDAVKDTMFWKLSSGQKTRVILAKSLLNRPKMLLMDEPTASLDPDIVNKIIDLIRDLQEKENIAILYTSHNMEEVARLCDRVAFLAKGRIEAIDTPLELTKKIGAVTLAITFEGKVSDVKKYLKTNGYHFALPRPDLVEIKVQENDVPKALFGLKEAGIWVSDINIHRPSLEDVFLHMSRKQDELA